MKLLAALLGIALIILLGVMRTQSHNILDLQRDTRELNARLAERSKADEVQAKCADQARKVFDASGYSKSEFATYENHYAAKLDKCMMRVLRTEVQTGREKAIWIYINVLDPFEGKLYGTYSWHTETNKKKYLVAPPFTCEVTLPTGEQRTCHSTHEFEELVKPYMEETTAVEAADSSRQEAGTRNDTVLGIPPRGYVRELSHVALNPA